MAFGGLFPSVNIFPADWEATFETITDKYRAAKKKADAAAKLYRRMTERGTVAFDSYDAAVRVFNEQIHFITAEHLESMGWGLRDKLKEQGFHVEDLPNSSAEDIKNGGLVRANSAELDEGLEIFLEDLHIVRKDEHLVERKAAKLPSFLEMLGKEPVQTEVKKLEVACVDYYKSLADLNDMHKYFKGIVEKLPDRHFPKLDPPLRTGSCYHAELGKLGFRFAVIPPEPMRALQNLNVGVIANREDILPPATMAAHGGQLITMTQAKRAFTEKPVAYEFPPIVGSLLTPASYKILADYIPDDAFDMNYVSASRLSGGVQTNLEGDIYRGSKTGKIRQRKRF